MSAHSAHFVWRLRLHRAIYSFNADDTSRPVTCHGVLETCPAYCVSESISRWSQCMHGNVQVVSVPIFVREVCEKCFYKCESLRSITFGASSNLERIFAKAFCGTSIESVCLPDSVVEKGAFRFESLSKTFQKRVPSLFKRLGRKPWSRSRTGYPSRSCGRSQIHPTKHPSCSGQSSNPGSLRYRSRRTQRRGPGCTESKTARRRCLRCKAGKTTEKHR